MTTDNVVAESKNELRALISPDDWNSFLDFVRTGEAPDSFMRKLATDPNYQEAANRLIDDGRTAMIRMMFDADVLAAATRARKLYRESPAHVQAREQCTLMGLLAEAILQAADSERKAANEAERLERQRGDDEQR